MPAKAAWNGTKTHRVGTIGNVTERNAIEPGTCRQGDSGRAQAGRPAGGGGYTVTMSHRGAPPPSNASLARGHGAQSKHKMSSCKCVGTARAQGAHPWDHFPHKSSLWETTWPLVAAGICPSGPHSPAILEGLGDDGDATETCPRRETRGCSRSAVVCPRVPWGAFEAKEGALGTPGHQALGGGSVGARGGRGMGLSRPRSQIQTLHDQCIKKIDQIYTDKTKQIRSM